MMSSMDVDESGRRRNADTKNGPSLTSPDVAIHWCTRSLRDSLSQHCRATRPPVAVLADEAVWGMSPASRRSC